MKKSLTEWDMTVALPIIADAIVKSKVPITNPELRVLVNIETGKDILPHNIRLVIHEIRVRSIVKNVVASSKGYWVAKSMVEVDIYLESLQARAMQIHEVQSALKKQMGDTLIGQLELEGVTCV
jgi:hypothetical protein